MQRFLLFILMLTTSLFSDCQIITSSNLPIVQIYTNGQTILDDPKIVATMGIINKTSGQRNNVLDDYNEYYGKIGIEIRGQSSQQFPMKSYSLELWNNSSNTIKRPLFGLPSESDWVLYAPYSDKTLMHNFMAYTLSRQMGHWAANCRFVELMINDEYKGIYVFMEKIKRDEGRVNVTKILATDISGTGVTGGYIFSIDKEPDGWYSSVPSGNAGTAYSQYSYIYPKLGNIVQEQKDYIKSYVDSFETALQMYNYQDKTNGWRRFADEPSFIDYFILNEVSRNVDGYRLSSFFYKDRGGKINAGPAWDYDLAFRNANYCNGSNTDGWAWQFNNVCPGDFWQVPFWWIKFNSDTAFQSNLLCRWKQLRQTTLSEQNIFRSVDSIASFTSEARQRHFLQWPVLGQYVWPNPTPIATTYEGEITTLKNWLTARLAWIDLNLNQVGGCATVPPFFSDNFSIQSYPNPIPDNTIIRIMSPLLQRMHLQVFDISGRKILEQEQLLKMGGNSISINTSGWAKGVYQFRFTTQDGKKTTKRFMK